MKGGDAVMTVFDIVYGMYTIKQTMLDIMYIALTYKVTRRNEKDRSSRK